MAPALDAFIAGYRMSLTVAGALLLLAAVIAFTVLGRRADQAVRA